MNPVWIKVWGGGEGGGGGRGIEGDEMRPGR